MLEVIIVKVPEDTPLSLIRKTPAFKLKMRQEHQFLTRQERYFLEVTGNITFSSEEWHEICKRGYGRARRVNLLTY